MQARRVARLFGAIFKNQWIFIGSGGKIEAYLWESDRKMKVPSARGQAGRGCVLCLRQVLFMKKRLLAAGTALALLMGTTATVTVNADNENQFESSRVSKGKTLTIGTWEQDNDTDTDDEAIEWIVLKKDGDRALIITKKVIDSQPFYDWQNGLRPYPEILTWENSDIRAWLNATFLQNAFTDSERDRIEETQLSTKKNSYYSKHTDGGEDTSDMIFLLSEEEASDYFDDKNDRMAEPTDYAANRSDKKDDEQETETEEATVVTDDPSQLPAGTGIVTVHPEVFVSEYSDGCFWWLRTPGKPTKKSGDDDEKDKYTQSNITCVGAEGAVVTAGFPGARTDFGVRPAMWIKLDS